MTAEEAAKIADEANEKKETEQFNKDYPVILRSIETSAKQGSYYQNFENLTLKLRDALEVKGYKVEFKSDYHDTWYEVNWLHKKKKT
jgi:hypothetical protein